MDFYEMTCKDIGDFCLSLQNKEKEHYKMVAVIGYRCMDKLILGLNLKKPKNIEFEKLFPEFKENTTNLTDEQKDVLIADRWREFLKG